jgi:ABC-type branched-subunit amino acid transport system substrate-binding protein
MVNRSRWLRVALLGAFLVLAACGGGGATQTNNAPIKIGITGPFTGSLADPGTDIRNAGMLAIDDINKAGGVNGRKLSAVSEDDACDAQQGTQAAQKLLTEGIVINIGGYCSGASIPESDVFHRSGDIPFITAASSNPKFTDQGYDNVFRMVPRDDQEAPADVGYMHTLLGSMKLAIMHDNTTYAKGVADSAKTAAQSLGMQVVYFDAITPGQKDYTSALTKVGTTGADTLFYTGYYPEYGLLAKEYAQLHPNYKLNGDSACVDPSVLTVAGTALNDPGITINTLPVTEFIHNAKNDSFTQKYKAKYNRDPADYSSYEYDGMMALAQALKDNGANTSAKALNTALHKVKITGITGDVSYDTKGDRPEPQFLAVKSKGDPPAFTPYALRDKGVWKTVS